MRYANAVVVLLFLAACSNESEIKVHQPKYIVDTYPESISDNCRDGIAKVYDECSDQHIILQKAKVRAERTGKSVLLIFGAEWCIWCHVFDKYINGQSRHYFYEWEGDDGIMTWGMVEAENRNAGLEADRLNEYVSENFVVAHIEGYYSPNGREVVESIGFDKDRLEFLPFIFSLDKHGKYADHMLAYDAIPGLEVRKDSGEEYRGFDRNILLRELKVLRNRSVAER